MILARVPANELAVENANQIIQRCQQNLNAPPTSTQPAPSPAEIPAADGTPTPES
jgi:hypothetical protein